MSTTVEEFQTVAEKSLKKAIRRGHPFTTDDLLPEIEANVNGEVDLRRLGGVMLKAKSQGRIRPQGFISSDREVSHSRPKRVWLPAK